MSYTMGGSQGVQQEPWMLAQYVTAYVREVWLAGQTKQISLTMKCSGPSAKVKSALGWLTGTKINRQSMRHKWARTTLKHHPQETRRSRPFCVSLSRVHWNHLKRGKFLKWFMVMYWLATLGKSWGSEFSPPPFVSLARGMACVEWVEAYFLHTEKCHEASEDYCTAYCRTIGEPWLAHKHILFTHGLGSNLAWGSYALTQANT